MGGGGEQGISMLRIMLCLHRQRGVCVYVCHRIAGDEVDAMLR